MNKALYPLGPLTYSLTPGLWGDKDLVMGHVWTTLRMLHLAVELGFEWTLIYSSIPSAGEEGFAVITLITHNTGLLKDEEGQADISFFCLFVFSKHRLAANNLLRKGWQHFSSYHEDMEEHGRNACTLDLQPN